jgi:flagellar biosynthesis component FlhA
VETHHYEAPHAKTKKMKNFWPFFLSILAAIFFYLFTTGADLGVKLLIVVIIGIIVFVIFALILRTPKKFSNFYTILFILGLLITAYQFIFQTGATTY